MVVIEAAGDCGLGYPQLQPDAVEVVLLPGDSGSHFGAVQLLAVLRPAGRRLRVGSHQGLHQHAPSLLLELDARLFDKHWRLTRRLLVSLDVEVDVGGGLAELVHGHAFVLAGVSTTRILSQQDRQPKGSLLTRGTRHTHWDTYRYANYSKGKIRFKMHRLATRREWVLGRSVDKSENKIAMER